MRKHLIALLALLLILSSGGMTLASDITNANFYGYIQGTNNSTSTGNVSVPFTANTTSWINAGILNAIATNVVARMDTGMDAPIMPGYGTNPWIVFYDTIGGYSNRNITIYTGDVSGGELVYFPGTGGMTVNDNPSLEPSNNFTISITGYINTSISENLTCKPSALSLSTYNGNITGWLYNGSFFQLSAPVASGYMNIRFYTNGTNLYLDINGVNVATYAGAVVASNSSYNWEWFTGNSALYVTSANLTVGGILRGSWKWNYGATFPDDSGNGNTATPTFRTTSSSSSVNATLTSFAPVSQAVSDISANSTWGQMVTSVPTQPSTMYTENATPGIFFAPLIHAIFTGSPVPESFFWYSFAFIIILLCGMGVFYFFAGKGQSALMVKCITMAAIMLFFALPGPNIYGVYVFIYFIFFCFGILVLSRSYGW